MGIIVSYIVGTAIGLYIGYHLGTESGARLTIKKLTDDGYLKFRIHGENEVELLKPEPSDQES